MPVMGEFHFSRYPSEAWKKEIAKIKSGAVDIISSYIFWIHHEEEQGVFNWRGCRDLRYFIKLCRDAGLLFWLRIGPFVNGECRNGGLPEWLRQTCDVPENVALGLEQDKKTRNSKSNGYMEAVKRFFSEIGRQSSGLYWHEGGPIFGVQIENEYWRHDEENGEGISHLEDLKRIAFESGICPVFWSQTAWLSPPLLPDVIPMHGSYAAAPWTKHTEKLPLSGDFRFDNTPYQSQIGTDMAENRNCSPGSSTNINAFAFRFFRRFNCTLMRLAINSNMNGRIVSSKRIGRSSWSRMLNPKLMGPSNWPRIAGRLEKSSSKKR